jgi:protein-tyrosine phosphatase
MISKSKAASQVLLQSQPNFRDLGGIVTNNGKKIRTGLIFRSGDLHSISDEDVAKLEEIGLATIIDFRSEREREWRPDKKIRTVRNIYHMTIPDAVRDQATEFLKQNDLISLESLLIDEYRRMVTEHRKEFAALLNLIANTDDLPLVFHCAAGKDRTGLAAIFLLTALGVSMDLILEDYYSTNGYNAGYAEKMISRIKESGYNGELMRPMLEVRKDYLDAALHEIEHRYGGLSTYLTETLNVDIVKLKNRYLI